MLNRHSSRWFTDAYDRWIVVFLLFLVFIWTIIPSLFNQNLPLDVIEGLLWGHEWQWGYWKHPPIAPWLTEIGGLLSPHSGWGTYLISVLCVSGGLVFVYRLALEMFPRPLAFCAILLTAAGYIFNILITVLNPNTVLLLMWPGFLYFFYQALNKGNLGYWMGLSVFAALGILTKYYIGFLIFSAFLYILIHKDYWRVFADYRAYLSAILFFLLVAPHLLWLIKYDFVPLDYAASRLQEDTTYLTYLKSPLKFIIAQIGYIALALLIFLYLKVKSAGRFQNKIMLRPSDGSFVISMTFLPVLLFLLIPLLTGYKVKGIWGMPFWTMLGIFLMASLKMEIDETLIKRVLILLFVLTGLMTVGYPIGRIIAEHYAKYPPKVNFPGGKFAEVAASYWDKVTHGSELKYVGGDYWQAGNVAFYAPIANRPSVFVDYKLLYAPWIDLEKVKQAGLLMVWESGDGSCIAPQLKHLFPNANIAMPQKIILIRSYSHKKVALCMAAMLPSRNDQNQKPQISNR